MNANRLSLILGVLAALAPFAAHAQGPRNINNCTTISEPGAYELRRNLEAKGNCLVIAADFVTIDLKGFVISGNETGTGISNGGEGRLGTTIRNGTVTNFLRGIDFAALGAAASQSTEIQQIRAINNVNFGIILNENSIVTGCTATGNGVGIVTGTDSTLTGNNASNNTGAGLEVSARSLLSGNTASNNNIGILIGCPSNLVGNAAIGNTSDIIESGVGCTRANNNPAP
jgi:hypothetical protein